MNKKVLGRRGWHLYQCASSRDGYVWTFYVRDEQEVIVCQATCAEDALNSAVEIRNSRIKEAALAVLKKTHTRELLSMLAVARVGGYGPRFNDDFPLFDEYAYEPDDIREILKDRPHIPNKQEARKIRQQKAKSCNYDRIKLRNRHHTKATTS